MLAVFSTAGIVWYFGNDEYLFNDAFILRHDKFLNVNPFLFAWYNPDAMLVVFPIMSPTNNPLADFNTPNPVCTIPSESLRKTLFIEIALNAELRVSQ